MADRFPLILNTNINQIQEIASGDQLNLSGNNIANAGIITATTFSGSGASLTGISNASVASNAAIAGTKISPNFGAQNIQTTGQLQISGALPTILLNDENNENDFELRNQNGSFIIRDIDNPQTRYTIASSGMIHTFHGAASFSSNLDVGAGIDVTGNSTFVNDIDVDGHTNLDNVNVVGVLTVTGAVNASHSSFGNLTALGINISNTNASINFTDTNANPDYRLYKDGGVFDVVQFNTGGSDVNIVKINTDGHIDISKNVDFAAGIDVTGNATVSGNLSVGGVLTYEDVTNVDSVGIVTAREGVFIPDNKELKIGNTAASPDLSIYHNGSHSYIKNITNYTYYLSTQHHFKNAANNEIQARFQENGPVELYYDNGLKFKTTDIGAQIDTTLLLYGAAGNPGRLRLQEGGALSEIMVARNTDTNSFLYFKTEISGSTDTRVMIDNGGHLRPGADSTYDLGTSANRWRNVYADTLYGDGSNLTGVLSDIVEDSSPQLGGDLDVNGNDIKSGSTIYEIVLNQRHNFKAGGNTILNINGNGVDFQHGHNTHADNVENRHGTHNDIRIYHSGSHSYIKNTTDYTLWIQNEDSQAVKISNNNGENVSAVFNIGGTAQLSYANSLRLETVSDGVSIKNGFLQVYENDSTKDKSQVLKLSSYTNATNEGPFIDFNSVWNGGNYPNWYVARIGGIYETESGGANQGALVFHTADHNNANQGLSPVTEKMRLTGAGHLRPSTNSAHDLGTSSYRWRNIYTNDLNLSNEGGKNDVDGTWGNYTIQEGESDLYLINKRNGKKYKFNLTEVS